jgi:hypothetical protein
LIALSLCLAAVPAARAGAIGVIDSATPVSKNFKYFTSGQVGTTGVTGQSIISFNSINASSAGELMTPSSLSFGTFVVAPLAEGATTTYDHTPFAITFGTLSIDGVTPDPAPAPITITGFLNGTINGTSQSGVVATFDPIDNPNFSLGDLFGTLSVLNPQLSLVPSTTNDGKTTAQGFLTVLAQPIPEPTSIAVLALAMGGLVVGRRMRQGR